MRRQNQNRQAQEVNEVAWPEVIYLTPDRWGSETFALTREELREVVRSLRELGEDWQGVSEDDATPYYLSEACGDTAIYEHRVRVGVERVWVRRNRLPESGTLYEWGPVWVEGS